MFRVTLLYWSIATFLSQYTHRDDPEVRDGLTMLLHDIFKLLQGIPFSPLIMYPGATDMLSLMSTLTKLDGNSLWVDIEPIHMGLSAISRILEAEGIHELRHTQAVLIGDYGLYPELSMSTTPEQIPVLFTTPAAGSRKHIGCIANVLNKHSITWSLVSMKYFVDNFATYCGMWGRGFNYWISVLTQGNTRGEVHESVIQHIWDLYRLYKTYPGMRQEARNYATTTCLPDILYMPRGVFEGVWINNRTAAADLDCISAMGQLENEYQNFVDKTLIHREGSSGSEGVVGTLQLN